VIILIINQGRKKRLKKMKRKKRKGKGKRRRNVVSMNSRIPAGLVGFFLSTDERERADLFRIIYETPTCLPFKSWSLLHGHYYRPASLFPVINNAFV